MVTVLSNGAVLPIVGYDPLLGDWWQVEAAGQVGWINAGLVATAGPLEKVAVLTFASSIPLLPTPTQAAQVAGIFIPAISIPTPVPSDQWLTNPYLDWGD